MEDVAAAAQRSKEGATVASKDDDSRRLGAQPQSASAAKSTGSAAERYPCQVISCNAMKNHPGLDGVAAHIAGARPPHPCHPLPATGRRHPAQPVAVYRQ